MGIMRLATAALAVLALTSLSSAAVAAQDAAWCAIYPTDMGRTSNCAFSTRAQCMAGVGGIGTCQPNGSHHARSKAPHNDRRHHRN
jgi:Protein of unknown function (DUF3551)